MLEKENTENADAGNIDDEGKSAAAEPIHKAMNFQAPGCRHDSSDVGHHTKPLYLDCTYMKEFEAEVLQVDENGNQIVFDATCFAPRGGGLPPDTGYIERVLTPDGCTEKKYHVSDVIKKDGVIRHILKPAVSAASSQSVALSPGDRVKGCIDWTGRYAVMRMHTACHILSAVLYRECGALITGNQIGTSQSRMDFSVDKFDRELLNSCVSKTNEHISRDLEVKTYYLAREKAMEIPGIVKLAKGLPPGLNELRIVEIGDIDVQADGGVHVARTAEIGRIEVTKLENKGAVSRRIYLTLK